MTNHWLEKKIAEATKRGDFDDLPGAGKPLEVLDRGYDPSWWAKAFISRERAMDAGIDLMAEIDRTLPAVLATSDLGDVACRVEECNAEIRGVNEHADVVDRLHLLDMGVIEQRWAALRR